MSALYPTAASDAVDRLNDRAWAQAYLDPDQLAPLIARALNEARAAGDMLGEGYARVHEALMLKARFGSIEDAQAGLVEVAPWVERLGDQRTSWLLQEMRAMVLYRERRLEEALAIQRSLEQISASLRPPEHRFLSLNTLGRTHHDLRHSDMALKYGYLARDVARECDSPVFLASATLNLGAFHFFQDDLDEARRLGEEALALALATGSSFIRVLSTGNLVHCYCALGTPAPALELIEGHLVDFERFGWAANIYSTRRTLALGFLENGRLEEAAHWIAQDDKATYTGLGDDRHATRAWIKARLRIAQGRFAEGLETCREHESLGPRDDLAYDRVGLYGAMCTCAEALGDFQSALVYQRKVGEAREEMAGRAARMKNLALQVQHQLVQERQQSELERAQERQRIMREIHDGICTSLIASLTLLEDGELDPPGAALVLRECVEDVKLTIDSLTSLDGDVATLIATSRYRLLRRLSAAGLAVDWGVEILPTVEWLAPREALSILRILQEALTNVLRHAGASRVQVTAGEIEDCGSPGMRIEIIDNGTGFDSTQPAGGHGLRNMKSRAETLGGWCRAASSPQGTTVTLWLPLQRKATA